MGESIRVAQVGMGAMGRRLTPFLLERPGLEIVAAVDTDAALEGQDLGLVAELNRELGLPVRTSLEAGVADVAVLTTVSGLRAIGPQLEALLALGVNVVTSCEELAYPWETAPEWSADIDRKAREAGVSVLGTGVNPGFLMDLLPIAFTAVCRNVTKITVRRYQDATHRRLPFQRKIGAGLTPEEFEAKRVAGTLRHVGLTESMHMIAARLGWKLDRTEDVLAPVIASHPVSSREISVAVGLAAGVQQIGSGYVGEEERIRLDFRAAIREEDVQDAVEIEGEPQLHAIIPGGVNGDIATCAILTNAIPIVQRAPTGLRTMADIPPVSWFAQVG